MMGVQMLTGRNKFRSLMFQIMRATDFWANPTNYQHICWRALPSIKQFEECAICQDLLLLAGLRKNAI
jgi:hypothetical protein